MTRKWRCWIRGYPGHGEQCFEASTSGKAKYQAFLLMRELGWAVKFTDIGVAVVKGEAW